MKSAEIKYKSWVQFLEDHMVFKKWDIIEVHCKDEDGIISVVKWDAVYCLNHVKIEEVAWPEYSDEMIDGDMPKEKRRRILEERTSVAIGNWIKAEIDSAHFKIQKDVKETYDLPNKWTHQEPWVVEKIDKQFIVSNWDVLFLNRSYDYYHDIYGYLDKIIDRLNSL